jgi:hypothetical protein
MIEIEFNISHTKLQMYAFSTDDFFMIITQSSPRTLLSVPNATHFLKVCTMPFHLIIIF